MCAVTSREHAYHILSVQCEDEFFLEHHCSVTFSVSSSGPARSSRTHTADVTKWCLRVAALNLQLSVCVCVCVRVCVLVGAAHRLPPLLPKICSGSGHSGHFVLVKLRLFFCFWEPGPAESLGFSTFYSETQTRGHFTFIESHLGQSASLYVSAVQHVVQGCILPSFTLCLLCVNQCPLCHNSSYV